MLKKNIIAVSSFLLVLSIFSVASLAAVTCSSCTTTSCSCSISECTSGLIDIFSNDCSESPVQSYTFTQSAFQWTPTTAGTYYLKALCNDGITQSACTSITVSGQQDVTPPTYLSGSTNSTLAGNATQFNLTMNDNIALQSSGKYIFGFDNCTGKFVNDSAVSFTSTPQKVSVVKVVSSTVGCTIRWFFNFTDNAGNKNESLVGNPFSFVTIATYHAIPCVEGSKRCLGNGIEYCINGNWVTQTTFCQYGCSNGQCNPKPTGTTLEGGGGNQGGTTNLPPSITLTNPQDKSSIKTPFTITFAVSDDVGINKNSLAYELKNENLHYKTGLRTITSNYYTGKCQNANEVCNVIIPNLDVQFGTNYYLSIYATDIAAEPKQKNLTIMFNVIGYTTSTTTTTILHATTTTQPHEGGTNYLLVVIVVLVLIALLVAVAYYFAMKHKPARTFEEVYKKWGRKRLARSEK